MAFKTPVSGSALPGMYYHSVLALKERLMPKTQMLFPFIHKPPYSGGISRAGDTGFVKGSATAVISL